MTKPLYFVLPLLLIWATGGATEAVSHYAVVAVKLNVRLGPGTKFPIIDRLSHQQRVDVREIHNGWARISDYREAEDEASSKRTANWVSIRYLKPVDLADMESLDNSADPRMKGLPKVGEYGITKRDMEILRKAVNYYVDTGKCTQIEYANKSVSKENTYYVNCGGYNHYFFTPADIPGL